MSSDITYVVKRKGEPYEHVERPQAEALFKEMYPNHELPDLLNVFHVSAHSNFAGTLYFSPGNIQTVGRIVENNENIYRVDLDWMKSDIWWEEIKGLRPRGYSLKLFDKIISFGEKVGIKSLTSSELIEDGSWIWLAYRGTTPTGGVAALKETLSERFEMTKQELIDNYGTDRVQDLKASIDEVDIRPNGWQALAKRKDMSVSTHGIHGPCTKLREMEPVGRAFFFNAIYIITVPIPQPK